MMGIGEFTGNKSIHWSVTHEDDKRAVALTARTKAAGHPTDDHGVNVDEAAARGRDPVKPADAGRRKGHRGRYRVRLRFERAQEAREAAAAAQQVVFEDGMWVLVIDVPVIERDSPEEGPPSEVRVDW